MKKHPFKHFCHKINEIMRAYGFYVVILKNDENIGNGSRKDGKLFPRPAQLQS